MADDPNAIPVFPVGVATTKSQAARIINKFLAERDGDDYGLGADDIGFIASKGFYIS